MLSRRDFLAVGGGTILASSLPRIASAEDPPIYQQGWLDLPQRARLLRAHPEWQTNRHDYDIRGTGQGQQALLWKFYEAVTGKKFEPHHQSIGDCVGQSSGLGVDFLTTTQIAHQRKPEEWRGKCSTEVIYAGSRVEIGNSRISRWDGSTGHWAADWLRKYGVLLRGKYGQHDLTKYSPNLARQWGRGGNGVPDELEAILRQHPVKTTTLVTTWAQACDLVSNGYPVILCSNVAFVMETDAEGFLKRNFRKRWGHAMLLIAVDTKSKRQGGCIANSWGTRWVSGPKHRLGTPDGCFWTDADNIQSILSQKDSWGLSNYVGYVRRRLDYKLV